MVDTTASRLGQINAAGSDDALFLKVFSGEVLQAFEETNVMRDLVMMRTIQNGKSAQFPATGRAGSGYHTAGENLLDPANGLLSVINHAERVVTIDDLLLSATFIDDLDEAKNHYDVRQIYSSELGRALATEMDMRLLRTAVLAARTTTPTVTGLPAGESIIDADFVTNGQSAVQTIYTIAQKFDEKDIPDDGQRYVAVDPETYYNIVLNQDLLNRDFGGQNGVFSEGTVFKAAGINIVKTNHLPQTNFTADAGEGNSSTGNFLTTVGVAWHRSAVGTVKLRDLAVEREFKIEYQGTLMVAKFAMGHGILRPESAIEITSS